MMPSHRFALCLVLVSMCAALPVVAQERTRTSITVDWGAPGPRLNPAMWGVFFEDINSGADGGLYAEMVKNRGFEFPDAMMGWKLIRPNKARGDSEIRADDPAPELRDASPHYLRLSSKALPPIAIANEGFGGMGVKAGDRYNFSARVRVVEGTPKVSVELVAGDGTTLTATRLTSISGSWMKVGATLTPRETDGKAYLNVVIEGDGAIDLDFVSLFPVATWPGLPLRADMVQVLKDLKPGFLRFPGGCIVEGTELSNRYRWKETIGPIESRKLLINRWNREFKHRPAPDYYQTFGLGFYEYFRLCEEIGAKPLPIINCGMACQYNSGELCPIDQLGPYVQDALDLIEFANGPATSTWGAKRAVMGHPKPFGMTMLGIGNEQWGPQYIERLAVFTKVLKEKHPEIQLIGAAGPQPEDARFHYLWPELRKLKIDVVDEHCYASPEWFLKNAHRYDAYDRAGPKVFFGEYAAQSLGVSNPRNRNSWECALAEAAFLTGLERNGDVVRMASYAPLFAHRDRWQWSPDLIWVDSLNVVPTPNYYVQQAFMHHRGDMILKTTCDAGMWTLPYAGRIGLGTTRASAEFKDVRVQKASGEPLSFAEAQALTKGWSAGESWHIENGTMLQTDTRSDSMASAGDTAWNAYSLSFKARKVEGTGGLAATVYDDGRGARVQWLLGGAQNTQHIIQSQFASPMRPLASTPGSIEAGRWYDVRVTVTNTKIECYLDGQLIQAADLPQWKVPALFTSATREESSGETVVKVVNPGPAATPVSIRLEGAGALSPSGKLIQFAARPSDENSFDRPPTVRPVETVIPVVGNEPQFTAPAHSFTVVRILPRN